MFGSPVKQFEKKVGETTIFILGNGLGFCVVASPPKKQTQTKWKVNACLN